MFELYNADVYIKVLNSLNKLTLANNVSILCCSMMRMGSLFEHLHVYTTNGVLGLTKQHLLNKTLLSVKQIELMYLFACCYGRDRGYF